MREFVRVYTCVRVYIFLKRLSSPDVGERIQIDRLHSSSLKTMLLATNAINRAAP
jgi:hypothetical protein